MTHSRNENKVRRTCQSTLSATLHRMQHNCVGSNPGIGTSERLPGGTMVPSAAAVPSFQGLVPTGRMPDRMQLRSVMSIRASGGVTGPASRSFKQAVRR